VLDEGTGLLTTVGLLAALRFLTVLPLPGNSSTPGELASAAGYFPVVGLLIGLILAACDALLRPALPDQVLAALLIIIMLGITGGLHADGLADTCDGLFVAGASPERRLEVMRDSRVGGYGVAGVVSVLLLQYAGLASLPPAVRTSALVAMPALSRWAMTYALIGFPYARSQGLGVAFQPASRVRALSVATVFTLLTCGLLLGTSGAFLLATVWASTWMAARLVMTRLPGLTGDTYGAINEVTQGLVLVLLTATKGSL